MISIYKIVDPQTLRYPLDRLDRFSSVVLFEESMSGLSERSEIMSVLFEQVIFVVVVRIGNVHSAVTQYAVNKIRVRV